MAWSTPAAGLASRLLATALTRAGGVPGAGALAGASAGAVPPIGLFAALGGTQLRW